MAISNKEKRELAFIYYKEGNLTQKAIAAKLHVAEKTISDWKDKDEWDKRNISLLTTKTNQLTVLYGQLKALTDYVKEEQDNIPDSKQADSILKYTAAIKNLETESGLGEAFEVGKQFLKYVQTVDFDKAKEVIDLYDGFIQELLKQARG